MRRFQVQQSKKIEKRSERRVSELQKNQNLPIL
jgi:hypothetical protein